MFIARIVCCCGDSGIRHAIFGRRSILGDFEFLKMEPVTYSSATSSAATNCKSGLFRSILLVLTLTLNKTLSITTRVKDASMVRRNTTPPQKIRLPKQQMQMQSRKQQIQNGWNQQERADRLRTGRLRQAWFVNCLCRQLSST
jgi:hypothetical protein